MAALKWQSLLSATKANNMIKCSNSNHVHTCIMWWLPSQLKPNTRKHSSMMRSDRTVTKDKQWTSSHEVDCGPELHMPLKIFEFFHNFDEFNKIKFITNHRLDQGWNPRSLAYQSGTLTITLECFLFLCEVITEPYSCLGDSAQFI